MTSLCTPYTMNYYVQPYIILFVIPILLSLQKINLHAQLSIFLTQCPKKLIIHSWRKKDFQQRTVKSSNVSNKFVTECVFIMKMCAENGFGAKMFVNGFGETEIENTQFNFTYGGKQLLRRLVKVKHVCTCMWSLPWLWWHLTWLQELSQNTDGEYHYTDQCS